MAAPETMSMKEYAKHRKCSTQNLGKKRRQGKLVLDAAGRVLVAATDAHLLAVEDPARSPAARRHLDAVQAATGHGAIARPQTIDPVDLDSFANAARLEKLERYRQLRLQNEELAGNLVRRDVVQRAVFQVARDAQEGLVSIVDRIGSQIAMACPGLDVSRVYTLIETEHRRLAEQLVASARALLAKEAPPTEQRVAS